MNGFEERKQEYIKLLLAKRQAEENYRKSKRIYEDRPTPNWVNYLAVGLGESLMEFVPGAAKVHVSGPFGLGARACISLLAENDQELGYIFVEPAELDKGELRLVDLATDTEEYGEGTIGWVNGFNHPSIPLPPFEELAKIMRKPMQRNNND